jgi:hypothetical protein
MSKRSKRLSRKVNRRRQLLRYDRKNWSPADPCMKCGATGPHVVEFSHIAFGQELYKASCCQCGTYQKFLNHEQAEPFATRKPSWSIQDEVDAPY